MSRNRLLAPLTALLLTVFGPVQAAPIDYHEAVHGDLVSEIGQVPTVFALDTGVNRVTGRYGSQFSSNGDWLSNDWDAFSFTLQSGQLLTQISLTAWDDQGLMHQLRWRLQSGSLEVGTGTLEAELLSLSPGSDSESLHLGAGDYNVYLQGFTYLLNPFAAEKYGHYELSLSVRDIGQGHTVPLPGSLLLAVAGLGLLPLTRRAKSASSAAR